jgi:D-aminopeptidase
MLGQKRIADYGIHVGHMKRGALNSITDVSGVKVGHCTLRGEGINTGVTAVIPHEGNLFREKLFAACHIINGFGKSVGLIQIEEMGTIETPILLTNTLNTGTVSEALVRYMLKDNRDIGRETGTVNPVVCECNDGFLNDIQGLHVRKEHVLTAIANANKEFEEGAAGAGCGMSCYQLKGGIGTASRIIQVERAAFTLGVLVLSNFGEMGDLLVDGRKVGQKIASIEPPQEDRGSVIVVIATDILMTERQLKRLCRRSSVGITRTGTYIGNGSGEIALAFSTANRFFHYETAPVCALEMFNENNMDMVFRAVVEAAEEAVLNSMICSEPTRGRDGNMRHSLKEYTSFFI